MLTARRWLRVIALTVLVSALFTACASQEELPPRLASELVQRVEMRWSFRESDDFAAMYRLQTPAYREAFSEYMYVSQFRSTVRWELTSVQVLNYDPAAAVASVAVRVMSEPTKSTSDAVKALGTIPSRFVEQWILKDGEWWYISRKNS